MDHLDIRILGEFELRRQGIVLPALASPRVQSLLAILAVRPGHPHSRRRLAYSFWPDSREAQALTNLRKLLHQLRNELPEAHRFIEVSSRSITFRADAPATVDAVAFRRYLSEADDARQRGDFHRLRAALERACDLYRGELLTGLYDDWILPEREQLHQAAMEAMDQLIALLERDRAYRDAARVAERALKLDSLRESTVRTLMRIHALGGDRASIHRTFRSAEEALRRELEVEPEPATVELFQRLVRGDDPEAHQTPPQSSGGATPLIGRRREWTFLTEQWRTAVDGSARLVTISGVAGIGKTRLAEEMLAWAGRQGASVASSRAFAAEGRLPFAPVIEWLREPSVQNDLVRLDPVWLSELARLLPELRDVSSAPPVPVVGWERHRLFEAVARAMLAGGRPRLLLLDDVQWCDPDTLAWLRFLLRFAPDSPLIIVGTMRIEEVSDNEHLNALMLDLGRENQRVDLELGPLSPQETEALARSVAGSRFHDADVERLFYETEGHPLFVVEAVRAALEGGGSRPGAPDAATPSRAMPTSVQAVLQKRFSQLSPRAVDVAGLAAVIGRSFTLDLLACASGLSPAHLATALDDLWARHIVRERSPGAYDFSHDRLRETAYELKGPAQRRLMHGRVARALETLQADDPDQVSARIAFHLEQSGDAEQALAYYYRAASAARQVYADQEVVILLTRALGLLPRLPQGAKRDEAELRLQTLLGPAVVALRGYQGGKATYDRAGVLCRRLMLPPGAPILRGLAIGNLVDGQLRKAYALGNELLERAHEADLPVLRVEAHYVLGVSAFWMGRLAEARSNLEAALEHFDPMHQHQHLSEYAQHPLVVCQSRLAWTLWHLGHPGQAREMMAECVAGAHSLGHPHTLAYAYDIAASLAIEMRDISWASETVDVSLEVTERHAFTMWRAYIAVPHGWVALQQGHAQTGIAIMEGGMRRLNDEGIHLGQAFFYSMLINGYLHAGRADDGLAAVDAALQKLAQTEERFQEPEILRLKGELLLMKDGSSEGVEALFRRAVELARNRGARSLELRAVLSLGRLWQRQGQTTEAIAHLAPLIGWFAAGDTGRDVEDARVLLGSLS